MSSLSKIDAARRQMLAAIHIHWYLDEPLAVYTLAANCWEISDALLNRGGKVRMIDQFVASHGKPAKDFRDQLNGPRNFLKHADRDPDAVIPEISDHDCDSTLAVACLDYMVASGRSPYVLGLFLIWFASIYPAKTGDFLRPEAEGLFPGLSAMPRKDQIAAARVAATKWGKSALMADAKNELTDNSRWTRLRDALG